MRVFKVDTMIKLFKIEKWNYTLYGVLFGLLFPLLATMWETYTAYKVLTFSLMVQAQCETPLLWIIDSAPLFLGVFAMYAGMQIDKLNRLNESLEETVEKKCNELEEEHERERQLIFEKTDALLEAEDIKQQLHEEK